MERTKKGDDDSVTQSESCWSGIQTNQSNNLNEAAPYFFTI